jgi:hypothetical protein
MGGEAKGEDEEDEEEETEDDSALDSRESTDDRKDARTGATDCDMGRRGDEKRREDEQLNRANTKYRN